MQFYHFTFFSKNKKPLKKLFLAFFTDNNVLSSKIIKTQFQKKKKKKIITILKSPHVNKTAQEQFEIKKNSKQLSVYQPKSLKCLYFLKKIKNNGLSDIKIKTKFSLNGVKTQKTNINALNPENFFFSSSLSIFSQKPVFEKFQSQKLKTLEKKVKNGQVLFALKSFCIFGELKILNKFR